MRPSYNSWKIKKKIIDSNPTNLLSLTDSLKTQEKHGLFASSSFNQWWKFSEKNKSLWRLASCSQQLGLSRREKGMFLVRAWEFQQWFGTKFTLVLMANQAFHRRKHIQKMFSGIVKKRCINTIFLLKLVEILFYQWSSFLSSSVNLIEQNYILLSITFIS